MVVVELAESHIAREAEQPPHPSCVVAVVYRQWCSLARLAMLHPFRQRTDSTHPVLFGKHLIVVSETNPILAAKVVVTQPVRVSRPVLLFCSLILPRVLRSPLCFLFVVTDVAAGIVTVCGGPTRELVTVLTFQAAGTNLRYQAGKSFVNGRRKVIDRTMPVGM